MSGVNLVCAYRVSDESQTAAIKPKLGSATKERCLRDFIGIFGPENTTVVADSVGDDSLAKIRSASGGARVIRTQYRSGAFSFIHAAETLCSTDLGDDAPVYLCEDDYLHDANSKDLLLEGLAFGDYCTLYDHPDKYHPGRVAPCLLFHGQLSHWRTSESTTMTFATRLGTLRNDLPVIRQFCSSGYPRDHEMFLRLGQLGRRLVTAVPGASTHAELSFLSPLRDWERI